MSTEAPTSASAKAVRAFLTTKAAREILGLSPLDTRPFAEILRIDGVVVAKDPLGKHVETVAWFLGIAAEAGDGWRHAAAMKIEGGDGKPDDGRRKHLADGRARALALVEAGEFSNAVDSMIATLMSHPKTALSRNVEIVIRMTGLRAALEGRDSVKRWIEVFF